MRLDHVSYAAERDGARATAERLGELLGVGCMDGGVHPRFGTRNLIMPLGSGQYVEVVEVLDHPTCDKAPFGQAVRARSHCGGGWLAWVMAVDDIAHAERRLGRLSAPGSRHRPDGVELRWRQIAVTSLLADPQLPFLVSWETGGQLHPSNGGRGDVRITALQIAGDPTRVRQWVGVTSDYVPQTVAFDFIAPHGTPGLLTVTFSTSRGDVTI